MNEVKIIRSRTITAGPESSWVRGVRGGSWEKREIVYWPFRWGWAPIALVIAPLFSHPTKQKCTKLTFPFNKKGILRSSMREMRLYLLKIGNEENLWSHSLSIVIILKSQRKVENYCFTLYLLFVSYLPFTSILTTVKIALKNNTG